MYTGGHLSCCPNYEYASAIRRGSGADFAKPPFHKQFASPSKVSRRSLRPTKAEATAEQHGNFGPWAFT